MTDWESNLMPLDPARRQGGCFNPPWATRQDVSTERETERHAQFAGGEAFQAGPATYDSRL